MALEPRLCLGLSSTLFLGRERHRFLPFLCLGFGRRRTVAGRATFLTLYNFLPLQRVHQVQRTVPQGRCAGPGLKPRVYSLCFLGPFCGTAEAVPSYLSQMETASGFLYSLCSAHLLDPARGKPVAAACLPRAPARRAGVR